MLLSFVLLTLVLQKIVSALPLDATRRRGSPALPGDDGLSGGTANRDARVCPDAAIAQ